MMPFTLCAEIWLLLPAWEWVDWRLLLVTLSWDTGHRDDLSAEGRQQSQRNVYDPMNLTIHPFTPDLWPAFEELFGKGGASNGCWCMYWRIGSAYHKRERAENRPIPKCIQCFHRHRFGVCPCRFQSCRLSHPCAPDYASRLEKGNTMIFVLAGTKCSIMKRNCVMFYNHTENYRTRRCLRNNGYLTPIVVG